MALPFVNDELAEYNNLPAIPPTQPLGNILNRVYTATIPLAGNTASRPGSPLEGQMYLDTDLGYPIWWTTAKGWVNSTGDNP